MKESKYFGTADSMVRILKHARIPLFSYRKKSHTFSMVFQSSYGNPDGLKARVTDCRGLVIRGPLSKVIIRMVT